MRTAHPLLCATLVASLLSGCGVEPRYPRSAPLLQTTGSPLAPGEVRISTLAVTAVLASEAVTPIPLGATTVPTQGLTSIGDLRTKDVQLEASEYESLWCTLLSPPSTPRRNSRYRRGCVESSLPDDLSVAKTIVRRLLADVREEAARLRARVASDVVCFLDTTGGGPKAWCEAKLFAEEADAAQVSLAPDPVPEQGPTARANGVVQLDTWSPRGIASALGARLEQNREPDALPSPWQVACTAPCQQPLERQTWYRVNAPGFTASEPFLLPPGDVRVRASLVPPWQHSLKLGASLALVTLGSVVTLASTYVLLSAGGDAHTVRHGDATKERVAAGFGLGFGSLFVAAGAIGVSMSYDGSRVSVVPARY